MLLIPAIDLKDGKCVRLEQGDMNVSTVFGEPHEMAQHWLEQGARRLHLVDLNGAFAGEPVNRPAIERILKVVDGKIPVQLGGGIRDLETIGMYVDMGISYVIIGTAAVTNPDFLRQACREFSGKVIVGLDAKDGDVAIQGWSQLTGQQVGNLAKEYAGYGIEAIVYTDIGRDGMLTGINVDATRRLAQAVPVSVIASGGLSSTDDIRALCATPEANLNAVICGRAIYSGDLDFAAAQRLADELVAA